MRPIRFIIFFTIFLKMGILSAAFELPNIDKTIVAKGIEYIIQGKINLSIKIFKNLDNNPELHGESLFLECLSYAMFMNYYKTFYYKDKFNKKIVKAIDIFKQKIKKYPNEPAYRLYYGGALGYYGTQLLREGSYLSAFYNGLKGINILKKTLSMAPDYYDIYYGLGEFHYYKSYYSRNFKWIPKEESDLQLGLNYLQIVMKQGFFLKVESLLGYMTIRIKENMFDGLEDEILLYKKKYPANIFLNYKLQDLYFKTGQWNKLLKMSDETIESLDKEEHSGAAAYIKTYYYMSYSLYKLNKFVDAKNFINKGLSYSNKIENCFDDKEYLKKLKYLKKDINNKINTGN